MRRTVGRAMRGRERASRTRPKTVLGESTGEVAIDVPRDRQGTFEPQIVREWWRRLTGWMRSCCCCIHGLTSGEISAHFAEVYGASVSREKISRITDEVSGVTAAATPHP